MPQIDLNTLAGGALAERIGIELQKVAANIADPNTKASTARSLKIEIKFKPDEDREITISDITVDSKLAKANGIPAKFMIDTDKDGKAVIAELASGSKGQMMIDLQGELADDRGNKVKTENEQGGKVAQMFR